MDSTLKALFEKQKAAVDIFYEKIDLAQAENLLTLLRGCKGTLFFTGVGKSGYIAEKIAATCISTGTKARFLSPAQALHGDLGVLCDEDILLLFSKSGESNELIDLLPFAKGKGVFNVGITSNKASRLARNTDFQMILPNVPELCPFDLAPTSTTAIQLLFGDALAIALMEQKNFTIRDFAANHPAGLLGRKITLKVADLMLMNSSLPTCKVDAKLIDTLHDLTSKKCGCLLVCDDKEQLKGIFTDGDLRRAIEKKGASALEMRLEELMSKAPRTTSKSLLAIDAIHQMEENPSQLVSVLPVVENKKLVGLLRMHDILQAGLSK